MTLILTTSIVTSNLFVSIYILCWCKTAFFIVYRPLYYNTDAHSYMNLLIECFKKYVDGEHGKQVNIITGDLNCPKIYWNDMTSDSDHISTTLLKFATAGGFHQYVNFETHGNNILDL